MHEPALDEWYATTYSRKFVVTGIYDGPINGYYYVHWGPIMDRNVNTNPRYVKCKCSPCISPCKEDEVPEVELAIGAPDLLAEYKESDQYEQRVNEMRDAAIDTLNA